MNANRVVKVLVVEADLTVRQQLCHQLNSTGYRATCVGSIAETLALPALEEFQAIFVDWNLPDGTARDLLPHFNSRAPDAASIIVTWRRTRDSDRHMLRILVRDNGVGFAADQREKAFEPFFTTKSKGTGLGLPICNRILDQHQGWLEIGPSVELGACMVLMLPLVTQVQRQQKVVHPGLRTAFARLPVAGRFAATAIAAKPHLPPHLGPFFSPGEWALAGRANLLG